MQDQEHPEPSSGKPAWAVAPTPAAYYPSVYSCSLSALAALVLPGVYQIFAIFLNNHLRVKFNLKKISIVRFLSKIVEGFVPCPMISIVRMCLSF